MLPVDSWQAALPLLNIASNVAAGAEEIEREWRRWRAVRPDLAEATPAEIAVLPLAWSRAQAVGIDEPDEGRLRGLQRKAALTTSLTLARVRDAQAKLRGNGVDSVLAGGASVVLLGAALAAHRSVGSAQLWVARADVNRALRILGAFPMPSSAKARVAIAGTASLAGSPGLVVKSRLPSLPPIDGGALVGTRQVLPWSDGDLEGLGPTEAVFVADVLAAARRTVAPLRRLGRAASEESEAARAITETLDRRLLAQTAGFDEARWRRLRAAAGWPLAGDPMAVGFQESVDR